MFLLPIGDINPRARVPYLNYALLVANIAIFFALGFSEDYDSVVCKYGMVPARMTILTLCTSMFLHGDIFHLFGNMLFLWIAGDNVEDRFGFLGYLLLYFGCGLVAGTAHAKLVDESMRMIPTIGASGAIAGVLGAYMALFPRSRVKFIFIFWFLFFIRVFRFTLASVWAIGFWIAKEVITVQFLNSGDEMGGVAYWAHIGGFAAGAAVALLGAGVGLVKAGVAADPEAAEPDDRFFRERENRSTY